MNTVEINTKTGSFEPPPTLFDFLAHYSIYREWWPEDQAFHIEHSTSENPELHFRVGILRFVGKQTSAVLPHTIIWEFKQDNFRGIWQWQLHSGDNGSEICLDISGKITGPVPVALSLVVPYERRIITASRSIFQAMKTQLASRRRTSI